MSITSILIGVFAGAILSALFAWFFLRSRAEEERKSGSDLSFLQNQLNDLSRALNEQSRHIEERLGKSERHMHDAVRQQFGESQKLIREITQEITSVKETGRQMVGFGEQLQHLQNVLQNPKQRGALGEYYLQTVLQNVLPPGRFQLQYGFSDGEVVDAVIFLEQGRILPIDSKFSLENYNKILETNDNTERERLEKVFKQDLKNRIDETAKYIRPQENTLEYAFMFIPSEAIYYDLLVNQVGAVKTSTRDLIEYAFMQKHVIIVSPTTFLAYLQTVLQGLKSLQIEEKAQEIIKRVGELGRHIDSYESYMQKLGNSLATTVNHYNTAHKELKKIDKDVVRIAEKEPGVDPVQLDRPSRDDE